MSAIVLVTGGFDPIHTGHIAYFKNLRIVELLVDTDMID